MAISVVQRTTGTNQSVTVSDVTAGNSLLVVWIYGKNAPGSGAEVPTDNHGNSYAAVAAKVWSYSGSGFNIFLAQNVAGGATTITISGGYSSYIVGAIVYELSGVGGVDTSVINWGGSSFGDATPSSSNMTTAHSGDFIYSVVTIYNGSVTVPSGYTSGGAGVGTGHDAYTTQATAGAIDATWGGSISYWVCGAVALYPAAPTYSLTWNGVSVSAWDGVAIDDWDGI